MSNSEISSPDVPLSLPAATQITIQAGERRFITTTNTLTQESGFFNSLLSGRWSSAQADGSYFIDVDASVFEHVLRYLRHGVLPVFYDKSKGHDYPLYVAVLEQAKYFQIARLETWIKDKTYLQAVKIAYSAIGAENLSSYDDTTATDVELDYHFTWTTKQAYVCPRGIVVHRGNPSYCGNACWKSRADEDDPYEEETVLKKVVIKKRTIFDHEMCVEGA
ncbi:MAG: hypothetical protein M1837_007282 [Sclerophora amabilis]|nr:MAG: hypothetical protein M1837_007282 [Sclerophora amabilis]